MNTVYQSFSRELTGFEFFDFAKGSLWAELCNALIILWILPCNATNYTHWLLRSCELKIVIYTDPSQSTFAFNPNAWWHAMTMIRTSWQISFSCSIEWDPWSHVPIWIHKNENLKMCFMATHANGHLLNTPQRSLVLVELNWINLLDFPNVTRSTLHGLPFWKCA